MMQKRWIIWLLGLAVVSAQAEKISSSGITEPILDATLSSPVSGIIATQKVKEGEFAIEGKAWKQGTPEPDKWTVTQTEKSEPSAGRASIWGNPFAGTPIDFDDLVVSAVK